MSRFSLIYVLVALVIIAVSGLAYYSYRSSVESATAEHQTTLAMLQALAAEKVLSIEDHITRVEAQALDAVSLADLSGSLAQLLDKNLPIESVLTFGRDGKIIPGGFLTTREGDEDTAAFRALFEEQVSPNLITRGVPGSTFRHHQVYDGRPYLFSVERRIEGDKLYFIAVETDQTYLIETVFPQILDVGATRARYQVLNERDDIIFGFSFAGINSVDVISHRFPTTLTRWRLRGGWLDAGEVAKRDEKQATFDLILITVALAVIFVGVGFIVWAMRRERRLNQLKSDFISNVSHELKTPLSIISMFGELLSMGRVRSEEQATEYAEIIRRESVRLSRLIDNVLDFAKIERGVDVYEFVAGQDLGEVVSRALEISAHRLDAAKVTLETEIDADLPTALLDANAMTLAVLNLVDNAIKYAPDGERLVVRVIERDGGLALEVRDFGEGVPVAEREQIFERFYRARGIRLKPIRGSGIGLALVRHIAEAHRGTIAVEDADGGGSCFRLWIPAERMKRE